MARINPHINFNGNCEEAFDFYRSSFGGDYTKLVRFRELEAQGHTISPAEADKIMHIALPIGDNTLIGNDVPEILGRVNEQENRSKISIAAANREEADKLFRGLSAGGEIEMPIGDSPWGTHFAMFRDKYGIEWIVETDQVHT